jgi:hypothetical protein
MSSVSCTMPSSPSIPYLRKSGRAGTKETCEEAALYRMRAQTEPSVLHPVARIRSRGGWLTGDAQRSLLAAQIASNDDDRAVLLRCHALNFTRGDSAPAVNKRRRWMMQEPHERRTSQQPTSASTDPQSAGEHKRRRRRG